jgi:NTP pyrophosphatase (non-canonical NTP hydrolase)
MTTFDEYQSEARRTQNPALPLWAMREHALYGLSSEVGEVLGLHQKVHQGHPLDETELRLEIGDVLWFLAELCDVYGWHLSEIAGANIGKLRNRYKDKFTVEESVNRVEYREKHVKQRSRYYARRDRT